ncbi:polysaccharide deacetylase family protein [Bacillus solimangrovi]|uniref:NodB homology domain-containing protein n=1 Tax=Bacillus solimangrovi TaxID=1305675 RepID=A0A1E5LEI6_9BACI|nr:polysaccharide deacetylase family protein [Bacillus solimangrovi]OEH92501.1 hypothetical protein BFG57_15710 [Bacillus solimangrovi]
MNKKIMKFFVAFGFFVLLFILAFSFRYVIEKYDILVKEHNGIFPKHQSFSLNSCERGSERSVRNLILDGSQTETIPILLYHRIIDEEDIDKRHYINGKINPMVVKTKDFKEQMLFLKNNGYQTLSMSELYAFLNQEIKIPEKTVVLTFDDGYKDNIIEAYPILKEYGFRATVFVITGAVTNRTYPFTPKYVQYASLKELKQSCDVFEYQSHTYNFHKKDHNERDDKPYLVTKTIENVMEDIKISVFQLDGENLSFAYPYGEYTTKSIDVLKKLGFKMAFTTEERVASSKDHLYEIPRFSIFSSTTFTEFKTYVQK